MGLPVVGILVKLVGGGIGLATEANVARKQRSSNALAGSTQQSFTSTDDRQDDDQPPPYTEQYEHRLPSQAEESITTSHTINVKDPESSRTLPHKRQSNFAVRSNDSIDHFSTCSPTTLNINGKFNRDIAKAQRKQAKRERKAIRREEKYARRLGNYERD
ncbi:hypothetical protein MMC32_006382 [Xylographa parallela]|nr:hypothetical protein [Xylographa parallela]